jgi:plastocyanin
MRRILIALGAAAVLALPQAGVAADRTVSITSTGFKPAIVSVMRGEKVTWKNDDKKPHQVVSDSGLFTSKVLAPGQTFSFTFTQTGAFSYHGGVKPSLKGQVIVKARPSAFIAISADDEVLTYGESTMLSGSLANGQEGVPVTIYAHAYDQLDFRPVTTVVSGPGGSWSFQTKPGVRTFYEARSQGTISDDVVVNVRPKVTLASTRHWFHVNVKTVRSLRGHFVVLQRRTARGWTGVSSYKLGKGSERTLHHAFSPGTYRFYISPKQSGGGYLKGWSRTVFARR